MLRLALIAGMGALVLGAFGATYFAGHRAGSARVELEIAEAIAEQQARHAAEVTRILEDANRRVAIAEAEIDALETEVANYADEIASRVGVCVLDPGDAGRLQNIR